MRHIRLKKWEIALLLAVLFTLGWGVLVGEPRCGAWWGVIYPELSPAGPKAVAASAMENAAGVAVRFRLLEWLRALLAG